MRFTPALTIALLVATAGHASAQRTHDITIDDYFTLSWVRSTAMSPDGSHVVYAEARWDAELDGRNTDLWAVDTQSKGVTRLTFDAATDSSPQWSPDGTWVYFISARGDGDTAPLNGKTQVWRVRASGGEPTAVTRLPKGVQGYELAADGSALYYTIGRKVVEKDAWETLRSTNDALTYGHGVVTVSELWMLDLVTWRTEKLVDEGRVITEFDVSDNEHRIAMITQPDNTLLSAEGWSHVDVYDMQARELTRLPDAQWRTDVASPYAWLLEPCWMSDASALAFRADFDGYQGEVFVAMFNEQGHERTVKMTRPGEITVTGKMQFKPGTPELVFLAEDHARTRVCGVQNIGFGENGAFTTYTSGNVVAADFDWDATGRRFSFVAPGLDHGPDVWMCQGDGRAQPIRLTNTNPQVDTWKIPSIQIVKWVSTDGTAVEGILELPYGYTPADGPLPLVVEIHGGPTAATKYAFQYWIYGRTLFPAKGWALLSPNYRGSTGYGDKFCHDLIGNKNNLDVQDILTGVDAVVAMGIADPNRMAVMGWSNGGYLTNCVIAETDRFQAASSGAGVFDTVMQWSIEDTPNHVVNFSGGLPWDRAERMHASSPLYDADAITTPTLIHVGEHDERVPAEHSKALHRALHTYLGVPCELVIYPDEGHGLTTYAHRKAKLEWDHAWFEHHVLGKSAGE